jgi:hypothetical protein
VKKMKKRKKKGEKMKMMKKRKRKGKKMKKMKRSTKTLPHKHQGENQQTTYININKKRKRTPPPSNNGTTLTA